MKKYLALFVACVLGSSSVYATNMNSTSLEDENPMSLIKQSNINNEGIAKFKEAISRYQFSTARKIALENQNIIEPILKKYSEDGLTPVQWMYSEYLLNIDSLKESAKWVYIALFNTRYDLNLCEDHDIVFLEKNILNSWTKIIDNARNNNKVKQQALDGATSFIRDKYNDMTYIKNKNPNWVCLYSYTNNGKPIIIPNKYWSDVYSKVMADYLSKYDHE